MSDFREEVKQYYARINGEVLPLGMGGAYLGDKGDDALYRQYREVLSESYETGVRYFDTSNKYGDSEDRFGEFLRTVPRDSLFLATKSTLPEELSPADAKRHMGDAVRKALDRLGVAQIDLFQVHDVDSMENTLAPGGALEALLEARADGLIRYIGLGLRIHEFLRTAAGHPDFDTILTYRDFTPVGTPAADLIHDAAAAGKGVINGSPLAFGLFTGQDPRQNTRLNEENQPLLPMASRFYDLCAVKGLPVLGVALRFPFRNPDISLTLTGPSSPEEWKATVAALSVPVPESVWAEVDLIRAK